MLSLLCLGVRSLLILCHQCDEGRPICANCSTAERLCSYLDKDRSSVISPVASPATSHSTATPESLTIESKALKQPEDPPSLNMCHLELFYQFLSETYKTSGIDETNAKVSCQVIVNYGLSAPYLMHEVLALAALHLSILRPAQQGFYRHQAVQLQTHALSQFNSMKADVTVDNCAPMFLFSSLLGACELCDTFRFHDSSFDNFFNRLISCFHLYRGVRAVAGQSWHLLCETDLRPILEEAMPEMRKGLGPNCQRLSMLVTSSNLSPSSIKACQQAIEYLQWAFDGQSNANAIFAWPVLVTSEYTELLTQRRPEALMILAYYAVLLYQHRELWVLGDAGQFLIESITSYLGTYWDKWLAWPYDIIAASTQATSQIQDAA
jgi:hypothetical protein